MKVDINKLKLAGIDDEIANQIEWTPIRGGGTNFKTATLDSVDSNILQIKPSISMYMFQGAFVVGGMLALLNGFLDVDWILIVIGLFVIGFSIQLLPKEFARINFDKAQNKMYVEKNPIYELLKSLPVISEKITDIHAIQLIGECVDRDRDSNGYSSYKSVEMNLITKDLRRICVMDHGDVRCLKDEAKQLAHFLSVPVWDAA